MRLSAPCGVAFATAALLLASAPCRTVQADPELKSSLRQQAFFGPLFTANGTLKPDAGLHYLDPVPVAHFDPQAVTSAGGEEMITAVDWNSFTPEQREEKLETVEKDLPNNELVVVDVQAGGVWKLGPNGEELVEGKTIRLRNEDWDEDDDDDDDDDDGFFGSPGGLTVIDNRPTAEQYEIMTALGLTPAAGVEIEGTGMAGLTVRDIHDLGPTGKDDIKTAHGVELLPAGLWGHMTPEQRAEIVVSFNHFLLDLPQFQGAANQPEIGVSIPSGALYAVPQDNFEELIRGAAIREWHVWDVIGLPTVPETTDRPGRQEHSDRMPVDHDKP